MPQQVLPAGAAILLPFAGAASIVLLHALFAARVTRGLVAAIALVTLLATAASLGGLFAMAPRPTVWRVQWFAEAGIGFGVHLDAISLLFALAIAGIALLAVSYSLPYIARTREGRGDVGSSAAYYAWLLVFSGAMLGLVFSADLIQLFVFWELAEIASVMLVGLDWRNTAVRARTLRVLIFTTAGGLLLLVGMILLGAAAGTFSMAALGSATIDPHAPLATAAVLLLITGIAVKTAQFPFHGWLSDAMAAPTPVNAFVDSVAVLAGGVFLLLRLHPVLADESLWFYAVTGIGMTSLLAGGLLAVRAHDLKNVLAWSTVSQYGAIVALIGFGSPKPLAVALFFWLQHAILKAGLFLVVGVAGFTREVGAADGPLWRRLPATFAAGLLLALSLAGVPPLGGFWSKELFLEAALDSGSAVVIATAIAGAALTAAYMLRFLAMLFFARAGHGAALVRWNAAEPAGRGVASPSRRLPPLLIASPLLLAALTLGAGLLPRPILATLTQPAAAAITAGVPDLDLRVGFDTPLVLSLLALALGMTAYLTLRDRQDSLQRLIEPLSLMRAWLAAACLIERGGRCALRLQNGALSRYIAVTWSGLLLMLTIPLGAHLASVRGFAPLTPVLDGSGILDVRVAPLLALVAAGTVLTLFLRKHLHIVLALGAVGYLLAGVFALALAPNLGVLQVHVETLVAVLLLLLLTQVPEPVRARFSRPASERIAPGHLALAIGAGGFAAVASLVAIEWLPASPIAPWFNENALALTGSRDVVAAVLVHFRALDTLGEIIVFATAAAGVLGLAMLMRREAG